MTISTPRSPRVEIPAPEAPSGAAEPHLEACDFSVYYRDNAAVQRLSAAIWPNVVTSIIGPSGCGKSTFLKAMNRMTDLLPGTRTRGRLLLRGEDVHHPRMDVVALRCRVGMVFQKPNPFPRSIYDNLAFGPRLQGIKTRRRLDEIIERSLVRANLWDEVKDRLRQNALDLSGGQQQRLCIARALAVEPEVLLMDESTSALDPRATGRIEELIDTLRGDYTVVIVTHNMQQASRVSDYTMFMYEGELLEYQPTKQLFLNPIARETEAYITGRFG